MDIFEDLYKSASRMSFKRAGIAGSISAALDYVDMILTPEQKEHFAYKRLQEAVSELEDTYHFPNGKKEEEEELAL